MAAGGGDEVLDKPPSRFVMGQVMAHQAGRLGAVDGSGSARPEMIDGEAECAFLADEAPAAPPVDDVNMAIDLDQARRRIGDRKSVV